MVARQNHGFIYEDLVIKKYNLTKLTSYIAPFDAVYNKIPVQIKCIKNGSSIYLGSYLHNTKIFEDFILIIGFHNSNEVVEEMIYKIDHKTYSEFLKFDNLEEMFKEMDVITNNHDNDNKWKVFMNKYKKEWGIDRVIDLNFKRDHKTQKRIQLSISKKNTSKFLSYFEKFQFKHARDATKDQFFTDPDVAKYLVSKITDINEYDKIIEPSAGCGSFLKFLPENTIAYDIEPMATGIIKIDYLTTDIQKTGNILVVGNPPFGRQSCLAKKFISYSCKFADTIAFILPKSFKKESMKRCFTLDFHLDFQEDINLDSFFFETNRFKVPCVFQIWKRKNYLRTKYIIHKENDKYKCVKKSEEHNVAFRRVGINAGLFSVVTENLSEQSHIFIKINSHFDINLLNRITFDNDNTVGPKSISKNELIQALNNFLK